MTRPRFNRILLKLSGEALMGPGHFGHSYVVLIEIECSWRSMNESSHARAVPWKNRSGMGRIQLILDSHLLIRVEGRIVGGCSSNSGMSIQDEDRSHDRVDAVHVCPIHPIEGGDRPNLRG